MTIQIDGVWVQCDDCGESCAMSHTNIASEPREFKKTILDYIKSGFEFYDLHGWKVFANARFGNDIFCGDCLKKSKEEV